MMRLILRFANRCLPVFAIVALNVWLARELLVLSHSIYVGSIDSTFIALGRFLIQQWPDVSWYPYWYAGTTFQNAYPPVMAGLVASWASIGHLSPEIAYRQIAVAGISPAIKYSRFKRLGTPLEGYSCRPPGYGQQGRAWSDGRQPELRWQLRCPIYLYPFGNSGGGDGVLLGGVFDLVGSRDREPPSEQPYDNVLAVRVGHPFSRRSFLAATAAAAPLGALAALKKKQIPIGLELYSVRDELKKDLTRTVEGVAKDGYQCVEFFSPYFEWTPDYARQVRKQLDDLGIKCNSTHNSLPSFSDVGLSKAIELNGILGTRYIVLAHPGRVATADDWKRVIETLNTANATMAKSNLHAGYHNHDLEWREVGGQKPIEMIASGTDKSIMLQLDVGTCVATGNDPVAWIEKNPGRIRSLHLKDWSPEKKYRVAFGEGVCPWKKIFAAAESKGGIEYYLIEQEGGDMPEMKMATACLENYKKLRA